MKMELMGILKGLNQIDSYFTKTIKSGSESEFWNVFCDIFSSYFAEFQENSQQMIQRLLQFKNELYFADIIDKFSTYGFGLRYLINEAVKIEGTYGDKIIDKVNQLKDDDQFAKIMQLHQLHAYVSFLDSIRIQPDFKRLYSRFVKIADKVTVTGLVKLRSSKQWCLQPLLPEVIYAQPNQHLLSSLQEILMRGIWGHLWWPARDAFVSNRSTNDTFVDYLESHFNGPQQDNMFVMRPMLHQLATQADAINSTYKQTVQALQKK